MKEDDLVYIVDEQVVSKCTYVINLDKDVTDPHHYRKITSLLGTVTENDYIIWNINTYGGDLYTTIMLLDAIKECKAFNYGVITLGSSAGSIIALALNDCIVVDYGTMFIHEVQGATFGSNSNQEKQVLFLKKKQEKLLGDVYKDFLSEDELQYILNNGELYLESDDCNARLQKRREKRKKEELIETLAEAVEAQEEEN